MRTAKKFSIISTINFSSAICLHLNRVGNGNDDISLEQFREFRNEERYLVTTRTVHFFQI
jgi:hypothetical protein